MAKELLPDDLLAEIVALIPPDRPRPRGGRPPVAARDALRGIMFVLITGIPWEYLPREFAGCSGMTCWRRLRDWQEAGVWAALHRRMLDKLNMAEAIDWSRASADSSSVPAKRGARKPAPTRSIAANPAANATFSSIATACRWLSS
jgi:transposase